MHDDEPEADLNPYQPPLESSKSDSSIRMLQQLRTALWVLAILLLACGFLSVVGFAIFVFTVRF